jgi:ParB family chromosome partitioning protein
MASSADPRSPLGPNTYQIVAGERRWRASRQAGVETIPALIEDIDDDTALEIAIIENLQRET